jgi:Skp family chaperone for outer membrane proteins
MSQPKNVQIPYDLFMALIDMLEHIDTSRYSDDFRTLFEAVQEELQNKKRRLELREDYSRLIAANKTGDEDKQHEARIEYFKNRNSLHFEK